MKVKPAPCSSLVCDAAELEVSEAPGACSSTSGGAGFGVFLTRINGPVQRLGVCWRSRGSFARLDAFQLFRFEFNLF